MQSYSCNVRDNKESHVTRSLQRVEKLYIEPKNEIIIGNFLTSAAAPNIQHKKVEIQDEREKSRRNKNDNQAKDFL